MAKCVVCGEASPLTAASLGVCLPCIRRGGERVDEAVARAHAAAREPFGLPPSVPDSPDGVLCPVCANGCRIGEGGLGYCGLRRNEGGRLVHRAGVPSRGLVGPYHDPQPTNCVAAWTCRGSRERGMRNLAVFYLGCSMDCLFCQNWSCRLSAVGRRGSLMTSEELAAMVDARTNCVCFFGGDPGPHAPHALKTARLAMEGRPGTRICWETNGRWTPHLRDRMVASALDSGGTVKVDLKAGSDEVHRALTGQSSGATLGTVREVAARAGERPEAPLLVVSTLLVPGYVDNEEVRAVAELLAGLDPVPPLSLLAFHPDFEMRDLPFTGREQAMEAVAVAREAGLEEVHVGNLHLLL